MYVYVYFLTQLNIIHKTKPLALQPHVEVTLSTSNDTIIKAVLIFAEGIFEVLSTFLLCKIFTFNGTKSFFKPRARAMWFTPRYPRAPPPSPSSRPRTSRWTCTSRPSWVTSLPPTSTCLSWRDSCPASRCTIWWPSLPRRGQNRRAGWACR